MAQVTVNTVVTAASLIEMAKLAYAQAMANGREAAAVSAIKEMGVLSGERIERKEAGHPGDFKDWSKEQLDEYILREAQALDRVRHLRGDALTGVGDREEALMFADGRTRHSMFTLSTVCELCRSRYWCGPPVPARAPGTEAGTEAATGCC